MQMQRARVQDKGVKLNRRNCSLPHTFVGNLRSHGSKSVAACSHPRSPTSRSSHESGRLRHRLRVPIPHASTLYPPHDPSLPGSVDSAATNSPKESHSPPRLMPFLLLWGVG